MPSITHDIRQHFRAPHTLPAPARRIIIKHPGYSSLPSDLLWFPAYDLDPSTQQMGCSHRVVLDACYIIANNRDGFLSTTPQRLGRVPDSDLMLAADVYYYFISDPETDYPVVAEFIAWCFPDILPDHWSAAATPGLAFRSDGVSDSAMSSVVKTLDGACVLSGFEQGSSCENAHLIPRDQGAWFLDNHMDVYNLRPSINTPNDIANGVCLRADIHRCLDRYGFVFFPIGTQFVAYFIESEMDFAEWYHRTPAQIHERVSIQFLYARFAYNIISSSRVALYPRNNPSYMRTVPLKPTMQIASAAQRSYKKRSRSASESPSEKSIPEETTSDAVAPKDEQSSARVFAARFPHLQQEVAYSDDRDYNTLSWHPEFDRMEGLKAEWFSRNPQIRQTSPSEGGMGSLPVAGMYNLHSSV